MANIYTSADQLIGKTPLLELKHIEENFGLKAKIIAKLEYFNPAGSVKDRIAKAMIEEAEKTGKLRAGSVIIGTDLRKHRHWPCIGSGGKRIPHYHRYAGNHVG